MPTFAKLGYPQIPVACVTELGPELVKKYPLLFFGNGTLTQYSTTVIGILKKFRSSGQIGSKVAMVNVADEYGIEISNISKTQFPAAGFEIVYNKSYPLGTQDYAPVIKAAKATNPDAFIAWSYPPDTFGLTEQAKIEDFSVKVYFNGIGCAFPGYAWKIRGRRGKHSRLGRRAGQRRTPAPSTSCTRKSPASMPTSTAALCTTRITNC